MARPIAETPILTGTDAERFLERMHRIDSLSKEQRAENTRNLMKAYEEAKKRISISL